MQKHYLFLLILCMYLNELLHRKIRTDIWPSIFVCCTVMNAWRLSFPQVKSVSFHILQVKPVLAKFSEVAHKILLHAISVSMFLRCVPWTPKMGSILVTSICLTFQRKCAAENLNFIVRRQLVSTKQDTKMTIWLYWPRNLSDCISYSFINTKVQCLPK